jgi:copper(I)-binding protein
MKISNVRKLFAAIAITATMNSIAMPPMAMKPMAMKPSQNAAAAPITTIRADSAWVRAAPPRAMMMAGYMTLHNDGADPARLVSTESDVFGVVEMHRTLVVDNISRMRQVPEVTIPAHQSLRFEPAGMHLMLMQERHELKVGDKVKFRLHFADGSVVDVVAVVGAFAPPATMP